jgi:ABC-type phosphate transport system substrate-binding protein
MRRRDVYSLAALLPLLAVASGMTMWPAAAQEAGALVMVVNKANTSAAVSKADAKRMLLGQMASWTDGQKVVVAMRGQTAERAAVLDKVCGMKEAEYTRYEMQVMFTGRAAAKVQEEPSAAAIKSFVEANPGAVGFVRAAEADKSVKVVLTLE